MPSPTSSRWPTRLLTPAPSPALNSSRSSVSSTTAQTQALASKSSRTHAHSSVMSAIGRSEAATQERCAMRGSKAIASSRHVRLTDRVDQSRSEQRVGEGLAPLEHPRVVVADGGEQAEQVLAGLVP